MISGSSSSALRLVVLAAAAVACAAEGMAQHRGAASSLRGSDPAGAGGMLGDVVSSSMGGDARDARFSLSPSSPPRSTSPSEENGKLSLSSDETIYPRPWARDNSWRFDLKHSVPPSPSRSRASSPRSFCARCNSVDMDSTEDLEKVNLRMDMHTSV